MGPVITISVPLGVLIPLAVGAMLLAASYFAPYRLARLAGSHPYARGRRRAAERLERFTSERRQAAAPGEAPAPVLNVVTLVPRAARLRQRRELVILEVARHPAWAPDEIFAAAIRAGLWEPDGDYSAHRERNRSRVARLRRRATERVGRPHSSGEAAAWDAAAPAG